MKVNEIIPDTSGSAPEIVRASGRNDGLEVYGTIGAIDYSDSKANETRLAARYDG